MSSTYKNVTTRASNGGPRSHETLHSALQKARERAKEESGYDTVNARSRMARETVERCGHSPYEWQMNVAEAILLGLDTIAIAGTGAGKTLPFVLPLFVETEKMVVILSPLNALEEDQARRFRRMKLAAEVVNGETWSPELAERLKKRGTQVILTSPEMCLEHPQFRDLLAEEQFGARILSFVVDECHCISHWGGDFRKTYRELNKLRAFGSVGTPFLATSATLPKDAINDVKKTLNIDDINLFHINRGNDRPNLAYYVEYIKSRNDFAALDSKFPETIEKAEDMELTLLFVDTRQRAQLICRYIQSRLPQHLRGCVTYFHSVRTRKAKRRVLKLLRRGTYRVVVTTEAAGMGADIPNIQRVIQFGVTPSLSVWVQRAGRAGRAPGIEASAILMVEESVLQKHLPKKKQGKNDRSEANEDVQSDQEHSNVESDDDTEAESNIKYKKTIEPPMRRWIETEGCRRDVADDEFDNPRSRQPPTGVCCDNCERRTKITENSPPGTRPESPVASTSDLSDLIEDGEVEIVESDDTRFEAVPNDETNVNGKRQVSTKEASGPVRRVKEHLKNAKSLLLDWRVETKDRVYLTCSFDAESILPDYVVKKLAANCRIHSLQDLENAVKPSWHLADVHGDEVVKLLQELDDIHRAELTKKKKPRKVPVASEVSIAMEKRPDSTTTKSMRGKALSTTTKAKGKNKRSARPNKSAQSQPVAHILTDSSITNAGMPLTSTSSLKYRGLSNNFGNEGTNHHGNTENNPDHVDSPELAGPSTRSSLAAAASPSTYRNINVPWPTTIQNARQSKLPMSDFLFTFSI